jgi:hypothetical protein
MSQRGIIMIAHCLFQTPPRERARCETCGSDLRFLSTDWYCGTCLTACAEPSCVICETGALSA